MTTPQTPATVSHRWGPAAPATTDPLDGLVYLSNLLGQETRLVQPGGGNTSIKVKLPAPDGSGTVDALLVKGSGTDLRTIDRAGFTRLSLPRLAPLGSATAMSDAEMMRFMAGCMLADGPAPSVETPLHSLLPHRVIAHTHDIATMSLTNVPDGTAERLVREIFEGQIVYVPYTRPGFPLARTVSAMAGSIPPEAIGLTLAHHGLVPVAVCRVDLSAQARHQRLFLAETGTAAFDQAIERGDEVFGGPFVKVNAQHLYLGINQIVA